MASIRRHSCGRTARESSGKFRRIFPFRFLSGFAYFLLILLLVGLSSCCPQDPFSPESHCDSIALHNDYAHLRFIHASSDYGPISVLVNNEYLFSAPVGYLDFSGSNTSAYYPIQPDSISLYVNENGSEVVQGGKTMEPGKYYTAYFFGPRETPQIFIVEDAPFPLPGNFDVRAQAVHLVEDGPEVLDVTIFNKAMEPVGVFDEAGFGRTTGYTSFPAQSESGILARNKQSGDTVFFLPPPYLLMPGGATYTLVIAGSLKPENNDRLPTILIFRESTPNPDGSLCAIGAIWFQLDFSAVRLVNLTGSGNTGVDLAFLDSLRGSASLQYFRRNLPGQVRAINIKPLEPGEPRPRYFFIRPGTATGRMPYRLEIHSVEWWVTEAQDALVPLNGKAAELNMQWHTHYTVVAYGPFKPGEASTVALVDDTPTPSSNTAVRLRLFHGSNSNADLPVRVRIGGTESPLMVYGQAPDGISDSFETTAGAFPIEVLDGSGNIIEVFSPTEPLEGGETYTLFLSDGRDGKTLTLVPLVDRLRP